MPLQLQPELESTTLTSDCSFKHNPDHNPTHHLLCHLQWPNPFAMTSKLVSTFEHPTQQHQQQTKTFSTPHKLLHASVGL